MKNTNQTSESKQEAIWTHGLSSDESVPSNDIWNIATKTQDEVLYEDPNTRIIAIENFFAENFFAIQEVEAVYFRDEDNTIKVWTLINELDRSIRNRIYEIEFSLMKRFPEIGFDFHVVSRNNRDMGEITPAEMKVIKRFPWAA